MARGVLHLGAGVMTPTCIQTQDYETRVITGKGFELFAGEMDGAVRRVWREATAGEKRPAGLARFILGELGAARPPYSETGAS